MRYLLLFFLFAVPVAYGDTVQFCQGQTADSIFWQKTVCIEDVTCEIFSPEISTFQFGDLEYFLALSQTSGYCNATLLRPVSYHVTITDTEFDYTVYDSIGASLGDLPNFLLYNEIEYNVKIETSWTTYGNRYTQFVEDDHGNLIEKPFDYTLYHEVKVKVKDTGW